MRSVIGCHILLSILAAASANGEPPPGIAVRILSPRFFPGWQSQNVCYPCVARNDQTGVYTMYYAGSGSEQFNNSVSDQWVTGIVTSRDTTSWSYPDNYEAVLFARRFMEGDVVDPDEQAGIFDSIFAIGACVIRDGSGFKTWYTGWNGQMEHLGGGVSARVSFRIGYATSPDGITWTKIPGSAGAGAVLGLGDAGAADSKGAAHPHVLKTGSTYRMWYEGYDGSTWRILYATSLNGQDWTRQGTALNPGGAGALDELGARNPVVIIRSGSYELWYQGRSNAAPQYRVMRATSPDGLNWTRVPGEIVLHPDSPVSADERILVDSAIVLGDNSVQVFFAKEVTTTQTATYGVLARRNFYIYTEVLDP